MFKLYYIKTHVVSHNPVSCFLPDIESKYSGQMGISKFLGQQRQHGEPALEGDNVLQDASASDTSEIFPGFQEKIPHGLQHFRDNELVDKRQHLDQEPTNTHVIGTAEKSGEHLQPDEKRLQLRVRVDDQLARRFARQTANDAEKQSPFRLRRFRQRLGCEQLSE